MDKGTSKNAKTNRKAISTFYDGKKVKPVVLMQNPLGTKSLINDVLIKLSAGKQKAVQLEDGSLLMNNGVLVLWDDISHLIVRR